jgi:hypothetical protein
MRLEILAWAIVLGGGAILGKLGKGDLQVEAEMAAERVTESAIAARRMSNPTTGEVADRRQCPGQWVEQSPPKQTFCVKAAQR